MPRIIFVRSLPQSCMIIAAPFPQKRVAFQVLRLDFLPGVGKKGSSKIQCCALLLASTCSVLNLDAEWKVKNNNNKIYFVSLL